MVTVWFVKVLNGNGTVSSLGGYETKEEAQSLADYHNSIDQDDRHFVEDFLVDNRLKYITKEYYSSLLSHMKEYFKK